MCKESHAKRLTIYPIMANRIQAWGCLPRDTAAARTKSKKARRECSRRAFFMAAFASGATKMLIVGAAMRKLLHLALGVLKSGKPFDPAFAANLT